MKTVIIGGGKGCRSLLGLTRGSFLKELKLDIQAVVDVNPIAPGMVYAREIGIKTFSDVKEALLLPGIELIIELIGSDLILQELYRDLKPGIKLIDHTFAHVFWDLVNAQNEQKRQLEELEKLEKKIEKERHFLQSIFDSDADLIVVLDLEKRIIRANAKFLEFAGALPERALNMKIFEVLDSNVLKCESKEMDDIFNLIFETGKSHTVIRLTPPPYESHWEITRSPILNEKGEIENIVVKWHKITERVMLKREVESAEQKFKSFINSAQDWISIKDLDGKYVIANPVTAKAFKLKPEDFIGRSPDEIFPKKLSDNIKRHDREVIVSKKAHTYDEIFMVDGQEHHFQTVRFPLTDYRGETIGVCTIARDVEKEVRLQEQLIQNEKLAALGKLAAGVAHEINNPLTGILAYAEDLVEDFPPDDVHQEDFRVIVRETLRCRDIVRNLLDFARQDTPHFENVEPNKIVEQTLSLVGRLPQFKDIVIQKLLEDNLPFIQSDPMQMQQVLINLMINAADAMKYKGTISLSTEYHRHKNTCSISVEDTGPGIPENLIDKIFEPFFSSKGTNGLGLAVSWGIVERHRGTMEVDMADSGGAIFRIVMPAHFQKS